MVQRRRHVWFAVLVLALTMVAVAGSFVLAPAVSAHGTLTLQSVCPPPNGTPAGLYYVPLRKLVGDGTATDNGAGDTFSVTGSHNDLGAYAWSGIGELCDPQDPDNPPTGRVAGFYSLASGTGTVGVTQSAVPDHPNETVSATSMEICVFDAELHSSVVGDGEEIRDPTFVGPDCLKEIQIEVLPTLGGLPTPPSPANWENDPHWQMTLSVNNGVPGIWFYDAQTNTVLTDPQTQQPLTELKWG